MNRNQIIEELYKSKNFNDCLNKMEPAHLRDDLRQEIAVIICQWSDDKVVNLHTEGALEYYVVRVIINQIQSSSSEFFRKFRNNKNMCYLDNPAESYHIAMDLDNDGNFTRQNKVKINPAHISSHQDNHKERLIREELEDYTIEQIDTLHWYSRDMMKLYIRVGTFRAMQVETTIPFISCYKNIQKSLEILRQKALAPKPLFTKSELKYIQNGKNETGD